MKRTFAFALLALVVAGFSWSIGRSQLQLPLREGPAPPAATVVFERTTRGGITTRRVYSFDDRGNHAFQRTTPNRGTVRRVKNFSDETDIVVDETLGTMIRKDLYRHEKRRLERRFLGKNAECKPDERQRDLYNDRPVVNSLLGYRVVKHTHLMEQNPGSTENCTDCDFTSKMTETWVAPELGCLPLRFRYTATDQRTGEVVSVIDNIAQSATFGFDAAMFKAGHAEKVKPTEWLRRQAEMQPERREAIERHIKRAKDVNLDGRYYK